MAMRKPAVLLAAEAAKITTLGAHVQPAPLAVNSKWQTLLENIKD
jgi:hypothetical protein